MHARRSIDHRISSSKPGSIFAANAARTPLTSLMLGLGMLNDGALGALSEPQKAVVRALVGDVALLSEHVDRQVQIDRLGVADLGSLFRSVSDTRRIVLRRRRGQQSRYANRTVLLWSSTPRASSGWRLLYWRARSIGAHRTPPTRRPNYESRPASLRARASRGRAQARRGTTIGLKIPSSPALTRRSDRPPMTTQ